MIIITRASGVIGLAGPPIVVGPEQSVAPLSYQWVGANGDAWNLTDWRSKVIKVKGATGFGFAEVTHWWTEAAAIPGSAYEGSRTERGRLYLPLDVRGTDSADWLAQHAKFVRSLDPRTVGTMIVTTPDQRSRWASCRYSTGLDTAVDRDPVAGRRVRYGITWDLADPYWHGADVVAKFIVDTPPPFFAPPGSGAVINIAAGNSIESGTVDNPGDVESYPQWTVRGPCTGFQVGVGDAVLAMDVALTAAEFIEIDMDPLKLTIVDSAGVRRWDDATDVAFAPIPPGSTVPLSMDMAGTGSIEMRFPTNYRAAW